MALNLEKQLLFVCDFPDANDDPWRQHVDFLQYGSYHHDSVNVAIHVICVPIILMTAFLFATNTPSLIPLPEWLVIKSLPPNLGTIAALLYAILYVLMEPVAGGILAPILLGGTAYANQLTTNYGRTANSWAIALHVISWLAQFVGHGFFEGRAPALLDNLVQAFFLAPFFVWMEILFFLGYRPELKRRLDKAVGQEIEKFRKSKRINDKGAANENGNHTTVTSKS